MFQRDNLQKSGGLKQQTPHDDDEILVYTHYLVCLSNENVSALVSHKVHSSSPADGNQVIQVDVYPTPLGARE